MAKVVDNLMVFEGDAEIRNFTGNYTNYREWKQIEDKKVIEEIKAAKADAQTPVAPKAEVKVKLTYKEKQEYNSLEKEIANLEKEKTKLTKKLSSGDLMSDELVEISNCITALIDLIDEKSLRWLELSEFE